MVEIKDFKEEDKIKKLGNKICKYVEYVADDKKGRALELAALADVLFSIREIFRIYDKRFEKLGDSLKKDKERTMINKNLEDLKEISENEKDFKSLRLQDLIMYYFIPVLEDFEKRLETVEAELGIYNEEEIKNFKIGGTDRE